MGKFLFLALSLVFILTGCAEKWEKPGATEEEFDAMKASCVSRAYRIFPPMMRQVEIKSGYTTPIRTDCSGSNGYGSNGSGSQISFDCDTSGGQYIPPVYITLDDNARGRNQEIRSCFFENGWTPISDKSKETTIQITETQDFTPIPNKDLENCCSDHGGLSLNKYGTRRCSDNDFLYLRCADGTSSTCSCQ